MSASAVGYIGRDSRWRLLVDAAAEIENVDQFFNEAYDCFEHGIAPWIGMGAGFPPDCPPGYLGGLPLRPKPRANWLCELLIVEPGRPRSKTPQGCKVSGIEFQLWELSVPEDDSARFRAKYKGQSKEEEQQVDARLEVS